MKEYYLTYEQADKLKDLGFDWKCNRYYTNGYANSDPEDLTTVVRLHYDSPYNHNCVISREGPCYSAPRLDQAAEWLRVVKDTIVIAEPYWECEIEDDSDYLTNKWCFVIWEDGCRILCNFDPSKEDEELWLFDSYELALSAGIDKALELLTDKLNR